MASKGSKLGGADGHLERTSGPLARSSLARSPIPPENEDEVPLVGESKPNEVRAKTAQASAVDPGLEWVNNMERCTACVPFRMCRAPCVNSAACLKMHPSASLA